MRLRRLVVAALVAALFGSGAEPLSDHMRAAGLLLRMQGANEPAPIAVYAHDVVEEDGSLATPAGTSRTRFYFPRDRRKDGPGVVVAHGVHHTGIDEPRLQTVARALAREGLVVLTPELKGLMDYHVDRSSIDTIGLAARALTERIGRQRVGIVGVSFSGGLALMAAGEPAYASDVAFVVAIGAHHDLSRVGRFFFDDRIERPDGSVLELRAHDYGAMILVYGNLERFVPKDDVPAAREAIRAWLWEDRDAARKAAATLSPEARRKVEALFDQRTAELKPELLRLVEASQPVMEAVSPRGHLAGLRVPIFLLHGAGDSVIPPSETEWLAAEAPPGTVRAALVTPAIRHVEIEGEPTASEKWAILHTMASVLDLAEREVPGRALANASATQ
jgi:pimeloyl-ACP methyl ester carboxylesterase